MFKHLKIETVDGTSSRFRLRYFVVNPRLTLKYWQEVERITHAFQLTRLITELLKLI